MPTATGVRTLVLSFTGVLIQLIDGTISPEDLDGALFYFGCTRDHALFPGLHRERNELDDLTSGDPADAKTAHTKLFRELMTAEREDRVAWRAPSGKQNYVQLNALLGRFNLPPIDASHARASYEISLPEVHCLVREQGLPYNVISMPGMD